VRWTGPLAWLNSDRPSVTVARLPSTPEVLTVAEIHHVTYGWFNPVVAFLMAYLGWLLGLVCTARSRDGRARGRRSRWLVIAAVSIGGAGMWLMHFMAMLGVEIPASTLRYDPLFTAGSLAFAVVPVGLGLFVAGRGERTVPRAVGGTLLIAAGMLGMHYAGMLGLRVAGAVLFDPRPVGASVAVALVSAAFAVWFATSIRGWAATLVASGVMAGAMCCMHYTGMSSLRVRLSVEPIEVHGISPFLLIVPITLMSAAALIGMAVSALQAMTEEEFDGAVPGRHRGGSDAEPDGTAQPSEPASFPRPPLLLAPPAFPPALPPGTSSPQSRPERQVPLVAVSAGEHPTD
jgi:NO-binding membrane sensor protein with MHYT domain